MKDLKEREPYRTIIHTYRATAFLAIRDKDPAVAAARWKVMSDLCDTTLVALKDVKDCDEGYGLVLDYKNAASKRYQSNLDDAEYLKTNPIHP